MESSNWLPGGKLRRRRVVRALTLGALGLAACGKTESSSPPMAASLGIVDWIGYAPLYVAREKGFFKALGLDLDARTFSGNQQSTLAFAGGKLDGLADITSSAADLASKGKDFRVVMVVDRSVGADGILARNTIASVADIKGKKVALEEGTVSHYFFLQVLAEAGLTEKDITLINTTPADAAAAYQSGAVEVAVTYAPFLGKANQVRKDGRTIYDSSRMPYAVTDLYEFDTKFIESQPQTVQAFVAGILQGLDYIKANPEEGNVILAKQMKIKPEEAADYLKGIQLADLETNIDMLTNSGSPGYLPKAFESISQFLLAQGQIKTIPDSVKIIEPKFILAARNPA